MLGPFPVGSPIFSTVMIGRGDWEPVTIPDWVSLLTLTLYGAGGNGGNGFSAAAAANRGGGGSGAQGGVSQLLLPVNFLTPKTFYLFLAAAGSGGVSYMSIRPETGSAYLFMKANPGGNGANSTSGAGGSAGTAAAVATTIDGPYQRFGVSQFRNGSGGQAGATQNSNGGSFTWDGNGLITCSGGAGGGVTSTDRLGGGIIGAGPVPSLPTTAAGSTNGANGFAQLSGLLPYSLGGCGGGSSNTGPGGNGGDGAPGSGGGGGGGGTTGGTGGLGGSAFAMLSWS